jgi:hypothetical protein
MPVFTNLPISEARKVATGGKRKYADPWLGAREHAAPCEEPAESSLAKFPSTPALLPMGQGGRNGPGAVLRQAIQVGAK